MNFTLARAHRRFLGLVGDLEAQDHARIMPTRKVTLGPQTVAFFQNQMEPHPTYRSGPLFGFWDAEGEHLKVVYAAAGGYIRWLDYDPGQPFATQEAYVLGWTDALRATFSRHIDWVGQWLAFPTDKVGDHAQELRLLREASALHLVDRNRPLLYVHEHRYEMQVRAYTCDADGDEQRLDVVWESER